MISTINESKKINEYISCDCKYKFDGRKYNLNQKWNDISVNMSEKIQ